MSHAAERARDLLAALELLVRHRVAEPVAYRAVHNAASGAVGALHEEMLDPRASDFEGLAGQHAELARRLRDLPRPTTGQRSRVPTGDTLGAILGGVRGAGRPADLSAGQSVERVVRDGLRELFAAFDRVGEWLEDQPTGDDLWDEPAPAGDDPPTDETDA